ncbi:jerky protein homolog-like [Neodiprion fabricii]|uniref:jerky protein homolog-like n=1 Tax=Neodiprion fabricii TaxID=2872261 RepID=UPI001ED8D9A0|nr:jerky protein homolog-like [Neodiprion fabricii]
MTETLKKRKRSDCSVQVEENVTESPPQSDINLNKEVAVTKREKLSADVEAANVYKAEFAEMVATKKLERSQVFNMDESGLVYKSTPKRTFVAADQAQAAGGKKQLERVTIATCSNADGSFMLPLILIGKSKNPRCLRNVNKDELPVWYRSQTNAWINKEIFEEWFTDVFVPKVESFLNSKNLPKTAVVLVDNCRSHRYVKINDIEVNFFPPNVTSLIQPMDQGIIQTVKLHYEINLVNAIVEAQNENVTLIEFWKTIDVHKVIFWVADAWKKVKPTTMQKCWKNLWPKEIRDASTQTDEDSFIIDNLDMSVGTDVTFKSITADDRDVTELLNLMKKVDGYEEMAEFDCLENIRPSAECVVEQNDTQQDENDFHYVSESFAVLYENL